LDITALSIFGEPQLSWVDPSIDRVVVRKERTEGVHTETIRLLKIELVSLIQDYVVPQAVDPTVTLDFDDPYD